MPINYKKYSPNWKTEIVPAIRKRSGGKCEVCGLKNRQKIFSYRLWVKDVDGRYKLKSFWTESKSDLQRILPFAYREEFKIVKVILTVAHLDHDETNHHISLNRLKDMCQYCHLNYDAKEKYRRRNHK